MTSGLRLSVLPGAFAVCRLAPGDPVPGAFCDADLSGPHSFVSVTRTRDELSIVCPEGAAPAGSQVEGGWRGFAVEGPLPFSAIGVLASLAMPLSQARISIFVVSTFDTDYLLVREGELAKAIGAIEAAGHEVAR